MTAPDAYALVSDAAAGGSIAGMAGLVLFGSVIPAVPTGAVVAAAAAYAVSESRWTVLLTLLVAALAALTGDLITYVLMRQGGSRLAQGWTRKHGGEEALTKVTDKLRDKGPSLLVASRLIPAGRLPVLLAAGVAELPWSRLVPAQAIGCGLWALAYCAVGIAGGGLFGSPLADALAAVVLVFAINGVQALVSRLRRAHA